MASAGVIVAVILVLMGVRMIVSKALKLAGFVLLLVGLLMAGGAFAFFGKMH